MLPVDQHELLSLWSTHCDTIKGTQDYQDNPEGRQEQVHILTHTGASNDLTGLCKESSDEFCQQEHSWMVYHCVALREACLPCKGYMTEENESKAV